MSWSTSQRRAKRPCGVQLHRLCFPPAIRRRNLRRASCFHNLNGYALTLKGNPVYLDVEGVPDRDFYYLIGMRCTSGDADMHASFWANDVSDALLTAFAEMDIRSVPVTNCLKAACL